MQNIRCYLSGAPADPATIITAFAYSAPAGTQQVNPGDFIPVRVVNLCTVSATAPVQQTINFPNRAATANIPFQITQVRVFRSGGFIKRVEFRAEGHELNVGRGAETSIFSCGVTAANAADPAPDVYTAPRVPLNHERSFLVGAGVEGRQALCYFGADCSDGRTTGIATDLRGLFWGLRKYTAT